MRPAGDAGASAVQQSADVGEARVVAGDDVLRARLDDVARLVVSHGDGDVGVLDAERAPETAALLGGGQLAQVGTGDRAQQPQRTVADAEHAQAVAGGVVGDAVGEVGADVSDAEHVDEEFGQFEHPRGERVDLAGEALVADPLGDHLVLLADGSGAGAGGGDDVVERVERVDEPAHEALSVVRVPGVGEHLAAAGLLGGELDVDPEAA